MPGLQGQARNAMPRSRRSRWRNNATWQARLERDRQTIDQRLSDEQKEVLTSIPQMFEDVHPQDQLHLDFVLVYGSYARGDHRGDSDLDIYFEATLPERFREEPFNRVDQGRHFQVFGPLRNTLLGGLRNGENFGRGVANESLVFADEEGWFRNVLIVADEDGLL